MIMFENLPYFVILDKKKYEINVDFRKMISFEKLIKDKRKDDSYKILNGLKLFYPCFNDNPECFLNNKKIYKEACQKLIWFYKGGREDYHKNKSSANSRTNKKKNIYSYELDDEYIFGAFLQIYNIDLTCKKLHWWKFRALLKSLPEECQFEKIKQYRAYDGDDKNMKNLKEYWEIPMEKEEQDRINAIFDKLK